MRLVVTEGFVIAMLSGVLALVLAWWTQSLVGSFAIPIEQPQHIDLDARSPPSWRSSPPWSSSRACCRACGRRCRPRASTCCACWARRARTPWARGRRALRRWLVGAQIAGSTVFLAVAGLFVQSYAVLTTFDVGFARDDLVLADFDPASNGYDAGAIGAITCEALVDRVRALPGVTDAAVIDRAPFFIGFDRMTTVWPPADRATPATCRAYPALRCRARLLPDHGDPVA